MKYRPLGATGIKVSEIGFGTWGIGGNSYGPVDDSVSKRALEVAFDRGVNFFDTSNLYGDGHSEELLGEVFHSKREQVVIATKGGSLPHSGFHMPQDFSAKHLRGALEESLCRLKTDYIDIYQLHSPDIEEMVRNQEVISALENFVKEGKIKSYGISVRSPKDVIIAIDQLGFKVIQVNYNLIDQRVSDVGVFEKSQNLNIGLIIRTPLVFGFLSGKLTGQEHFQGVDHRANWPKDQLERWAKAPELYRKLNEGKTRTYVQLALRFCLSESSVSTVIPGMMNETEVEENIATVDVPELSSGELEQIRNIYLNHTFYDDSAKSRGRQ
jgi:aryl-alcohol dehydrogenase-like predicted oxidoreductase